MAKKGIVLEGGGHRGIYSAGVLDALLENNIIADGVIGVSAGAVHACNYISRQKGRSVRYMSRYCSDIRYMSALSLLFTGNLFNAHFCYKTLPQKLDVFDYDAFEKSNVPLYVVCTDVETGKSIYKHLPSLKADGMKWLQGSASMPVVSRIVNVDGKKILDGGVSDSIPLKAFKDLGFEKNLVVLTQPRGYTKKPNSMQGIISALYKNKYPNLVEASAKRHVDYNNAIQFIAQEEERGTCLVLAPKNEPNVSRTDKNGKRIKALHAQGYADALSRLEEIRTFFAD